jgi:tryptophan 2,3-dioxygenase
MLTYGSYLRLPELLGLQSPVGPAPGSDQRLFIVTHQVYELWFMLLIDALEETRDSLLAADAHTAWRRLARVITLQRLLPEQVELLETMSPREFAGFRGYLGSASGIQSAQHCEIEYLSGVRDPAYLRRARWLSEVERARLERRLAEPSVWDGYLRMMGSRGLRVDSPGQVVASLATVAADEHAYRDLWAIADDLRAYDELAAAWRLRHTQLAERYIGTAEGTGGSRGAAYLRDRIDRRYFPPLWELDPARLPRPGPCAGLAPTAARWLVT